VSPLPVDLGGGADLRRLSVDHLGEIWALVEAERERIAVWLPWVDATRTIEDQRRWLEEVVADERNLEGCGIFVDGSYAGGAGLRLDPHGLVGEIGYWIGSAHEGRGFVTGATRALIEIGFRELALHRITIHAGVDNVRSRAIPERLGFTQEGVLREEGFGSIGFYDSVVYGLLAREWTGR
jgi:ribosomal-protein-serine acetyltransferase